VSRPVPRILVWLLAGLAVLLIASATVLAIVRTSGRPAGAAALSAAQNAAVGAARQEAINIQTYRRKSFDADFQAALDGLTTLKRTQWEANKASLKAQLNSQQIDAAATVSGAGLVSFSGDTAVVAVASDTQRVDAKGKTTTTARNRFQITMKLVKGRWLMDDLESVSVS
jgi:serine/threonine protein kinase, bacterial